MKDNKGVTIITLAITVIVLAILAVTVISNGKKSIEISKKQQFISELEMVQSKVNTISEKIENSQTERNYYNSAGKAIDNLDQSKLTLILKRTPKNGTSFTTSNDGFQYFETAELEKIGISGVSQAILINFSTREVYSYTGIELDGKMHYKLQDLGHSSWNIEYTGISKTNPTFDVSVTKLSTNRWKIVVNNIVTANSIEIATISYKLSTSVNWIIANSTEFEVEAMGTYNIKVTDKAGNTMVIEKYIE